MVIPVVKSSLLVILTSCMIMGEIRATHASENTSDSSSSDVSEITSESLPGEVLQHTSEYISEHHSQRSQHTRSTHADIVPELIQYPPGQGQILGVRCVEAIAETTHIQNSYAGTSRSNSIRSSAAIEPHSETYTVPTVRVTSPQTADTVTISVQGRCREVQVQLRQVDTVDFWSPDSPTRQLSDRDFSPHDLDEPNSSWQTRPGSGWYWLLTR